MIKRIVLIAISLILLVIENSLLPFYAIRGGFPSVLFVFAIAYSIINGKKEAMFIGIVSGILQDVFFANGFGVNCLTNLLLCFFAAKLTDSILKEKRIIPVIVCLLMSLIKIFMVMIIFKIFGLSIRVEASLISAALNTIVMILVYKMILTACNKFLRNEEWRF